MPGEVEALGGQRDAAAAVLMTSPVEVYLTLMLIYFGVNGLLSLGMRRLEDRRLFGKVFVRF